MTKIRTTILAALVAITATGAAAGGFLDDEFAALGGGSSSLWRTQEIGGPEVGGEAVPSLHGPRDVGTKLKAGFLSMLMPGLGQLYNGDRDRALIFGIGEVGVWTSYFVLHTMARNATDDYQEYAGIFAGTEGDHPDTYWRSVGRYETSDDYNLEMIREARAEGEEPTGLIGEADAWFWRNEDYRTDYLSLRADANRAYDRRDFVILFAIVNRAISAYDAVRRAGGDHMLELGGLGLDIESRRVLGRTASACVISGSF